MIVTAARRWKNYSSSVRGMEKDTGGHTVMEEGLKFDYYYGVQSNSFHSIGFRDC